ncbi:MAG: ATP-binding protein [Phycisphaerales bacterium]
MSVRPRRNPARAVAVLVFTGVLSALLTAGAIAMGVYTIGQARQAQADASMLSESLHNAMDAEIRARARAATDDSASTLQELERAKATCQETISHLILALPNPELLASAERIGARKAASDEAAARLRAAKEAVAEAERQFVITKSEADDALANIRHLISSAVGRARIRELVAAKQAPRPAESADGEGALKATSLTSLMQRLHALDSDVLEIALTLEQLANLTRREDVADVRDNRLLPLMARCQDVASQVEEQAPGVADKIASELRQVIFGHGARLEPESQTVVDGTGGLLRARVAALQAQAALAHVTHEHAERLGDLTRLTMEGGRALEAHSVATTQQSERTLSAAWALMGVVMCVSTGLLVVTGLRVARATRRQFDDITAAHASLDEQNRLMNATNEKLRHTVEERERLQEELVVASRQAGRAEVASGVLHNVGNVLNSVNIAASAVATTARASEVRTLVRAADMLRSHRAGLGELFAPGQKGEALADLVIALAERLTKDNDEVLRDVDALMRGIEHIRHVINSQQSRARRPAVIQAVRPEELVDAALQMHADGLRRFGVRVEKRIEITSEVDVDKHAVLEILLNLFANAGKAMRESAERVLTISADRCIEEGEERFFIDVRDTGTGIAPENLTRVFGAGFTTRSDGHGFGLHSSANAAQRLGGSLTARSEGLGRGASFRLVLPVRGAAGVSQGAPAEGSAPLAEAA